MAWNCSLEKDKFLGKSFRNERDGDEGDIVLRGRRPEGCLGSRFGEPNRKDPGVRIQSTVCRNGHHRTVAVGLDGTFSGVLRPLDHQLSYGINKRIHRI